MTEDMKAALNDLTKPIIGIENRTAQEAFDIMADRIRRKVAALRASTDAEAVGGEGGYLVRKGGYYYRPNAQGYTTDKAQAGRYSLEDAIRHSHPNGPDGPRDGMSYELATTLPHPPVADAAVAGEVHEDHCEAMQRPRADCTCAPTVHPAPAEPVGLADDERAAFIRLLDAADRFNGVYSCSDRVAGPYQGQMILAAKNAYRVLGIGRTERHEPLSEPVALREALSYAISCLCSVRKNYEENNRLWNDVSRAITEGNAALTATPADAAREGEEMEKLRKWADEWPHWQCNDDIVAMIRKCLATPQPAQAVQIKVRDLGLYGKAFDMPGPRRAYTYEHQPNNDGAYNLGVATNQAINDSAGDCIDRGLSLLRRLHERGFGVFEIEALASKPGGEDTLQKGPGQ